jgi:hypothetical protein
MKKILLLSTVIFLSFAAGCEKNENTVQDKGLDATQVDSIDPADRFQQADDQISTLTDQIENPEQSLDQRKKILCEEFPKTYQDKYIPALLALNAKDTSQEQLIAEMQFTLQYYQQQLNIQC